MSFADKFGAESGGGLSGHLPTFLGALTAFLSAFTTVVMVVGVLLTFLGTGITDFRAEFADVSRELAISGNKRSRRKADRGAVTVQADAVGHHSDVRFFQATVEALVTGNGAGQAGIETTLLLWIEHTF